MAHDPALASLNEADLKAFGARLREKRQEAGLTQQELAGEDISAAYISRIEAGQRRPDYLIAQRLAERLSTSLQYLTAGVEPADQRETLLAIRYAELALRSGEAADAVRELSQLRAERRALGPDASQVIYLLGLAHETLGDLKNAAICLEDALRETTGADALPVALALCRCYRDAGDLARSIQVGEQARSRAEADGLFGADDEIRLTLTLASAYFERGDVFYAGQLCQQAITRAETQESASARAAAYWNGSVIAAEQGQHREALAMADRALALMSEGDDDRSLARLRLQHGAILLGQDEPDVELALAQLQQAREELAATGSGGADVARCDVELARAYFALGDFDAAELQAEGAIELAGSSALLVTADALTLLGRLAATRGDLVAARSIYSEAVARLTGVQADREVAQLWYQLGELLEQAGDDAGARDAFRSASASLGLRRSTGVAVTA